MPRGLKSLQERIEELDKFAGANKNMHKEVKAIAIDLKKLVTQSIKEVAVLQNRNRELENRPTEGKKEMRDSGCQIDLMKTKPELNIEDIHTFEEFASRKNREWEEHKFEYAAIKTGSVLEEGCQPITLICC